MGNKSKEVHFIGAINFFVFLFVMIFLGAFIMQCGPEIKVTNFNATLKATMGSVEIQNVPYEKRDVLYTKKIFAIGYEVDGKDFLKKFPESFIQISGHGPEKSTRIWTNKEKEVVEYLKNI